MDTEDRTVSEIASLLADDCTQTILVQTATNPMSASELSTACDVSPQTVYRRLEELTEQDLVDETLQPDPEGNHYKVYTATLDRVVIDISPDGLELTLSRHDRMADRFTRFVDEVRDR